jgi:sec-independent protein translocase protein TatB
MWTVPGMPAARYRSLAMEIFGIGGFEVALVIIIALVVAGPGRMAVWARTLGRWVSKMRQLWSVTAAQLQRELDDAGVDFKVPRDIPTRRTIVQELSRSSTVAEFRKPIEEFQSALKEGQDAAREVSDTLRGPAKEISAVRNEVENASRFKPVRPMPVKPDRPPAKPPSTPAQDFGTWGGGDAPSTPAAPPTDLGTWGTAKTEEQE